MLFNKNEQPLVRELHLDPVLGPQEAIFMAQLLEAGYASVEQAATTPLVEQQQPPVPDYLRQEPWRG